MRGPIGAPYIYSGGSEYQTLIRCLLGRDLRSGPCCSAFFSRRRSCMPPIAIVRGVSGGRGGLVGKSSGFCVLSVGPSRSRTTRLVQGIAKGRIARFRRLAIGRRRGIVRRLGGCSQGYVSLCTRGFHERGVGSKGSLICFKEIRARHRCEGYSRRIGRKRTGSKGEGPKLRLRMRVVISQGSIARAMELSPLTEDGNSFGRLGNGGIVINFRRVR